MKIKAIIFDKDGTLLDFDAFWVNVAVGAVSEILRKVNADASLADELLASVGADRKIALLNGLLCKGTYARISDAFYNVLKNAGYDIELDGFESTVVEAFHNNFSKGKIIPTCENLKEVIKKLISMGIKTAVVTTDDRYVTEKCLDKLGIKELFRRIYTDDGISPSKPNPYYINRFCADEGLIPDEILMVGDTMTDMKFAENGGVKAIGVTKCEEGRNLLKSKAYAVIEDISHIFDVINSMEVIAG